MVAINRVFAKMVNMWEGSSFFVDWTESYNVYKKGKQLY